MAAKKKNNFLIRQRAERGLGLLVLLVLILAGVLGQKGSLSGNESAMEVLLEENQHLKLNSNNIYEVLLDGSNELSGYICTGEEMGYGGPLKVALLVDTSIHIQNLIIVSHNETPSFVDKIAEKGFQRQLIGLDYTDGFSLEENLNAVSGATYTSRALAGASGKSCMQIAKEQKGYTLPAESSPAIKFGLPEILLILLFALSFFGIYSKTKWKKTLRWIIMITSLILLGFWLNIPLSMLKINTLLTGYWPDWHTGIYWYLLIGGCILTLLLSNKRIYCTWICPFGAAQDCLSFLAKNTYNPKGRTRNILSWVQRILAFASIAAALYFRNPGKLNFEIFGTFFNLTGSSFLFILTGTYVLSSLFITRPYCDTLCPIKPFEEFLLMLKKWIFPKKINAQQ